MCLGDFWDFKDSGCDKCNCDKNGTLATTTGYSCNNMTGHCVCIEGVKGQYCNECDERWVLVKQEGCRKCDSCVHTLLDDVEELIMRAEQTEDGNKNSSLTFKAHNKLIRLENEFNSIKDDYLKLQSDQDFETKIPLINIKKTIERINNVDLPNLKQMTQYPIEDKIKNLNGLVTEADTFNQEINELRMKLDLLDKIINELDRNNLHNLKNITEEQLTMFETIVDEISKKNINESLKRFDDLFQQYNNANETVQTLKNRFDTQMSQMELIKKKNQFIQSSLSELKALIEKAKNLEEFKSRDVTFKAYFDNLAQIRTETDAMQQNSQQTLALIRDLTKKADNILSQSNDDINELNGKVATLQDIYKDHDQKYQDLRQICLVGEQKASEMSIQSKNWQNKVLRSQQGLVAFEMAKVYETIANSLTDANQKSSEILKNFTETSTEITDLLNKSEELKKRNNDLFDKSQTEINKKVTNDIEHSKLEQNYNDLEKKSRSIDKSMKRIDEWIKNTMNSDKVLTTLQTDLEKQDKDLNENKVKANDLIKRIDSLDSLKGNLPKDNFQRYKRSSNGGEQLLSSIESSIENLRTSGSLINDTVKNLVTDNGFDEEFSLLRQQIFDLGRLIDASRDIANKISVAVNFTDKSVIKLRESPEFQPSMRTTLSLYVQTHQSYAPIAVIYNDTEFLALYIASGRPTLQYRLTPTGPVTTLTVAKQINDGNWHKILLERVGRVSRMFVYSQSDRYPVDDSVQSADDSVIFNLDPNNSKFVLGQFMHEDPTLPNEVRRIAAYERQFKGAIDEVKLNGQLFGLWNYKMARNIKGEPSRSFNKETDQTEVDTSVNSKAIQFKENSFMCLPRSTIRFTAKQPLDVTIKFKTNSLNSLLWIYKNEENQYIAIYLDDGLINVEFYLSSQLRELLFVKYPDNAIKLNDNKFHSIHIRMSLEDIKERDRVDDEVQSVSILAEERIDQDNSRLIGEANYKISRHIRIKGQQCFGGIPSTMKENKFKDLRFTSLEGCIASVLIPSYKPEPLNLQELLDTTNTANVDAKCTNFVDQCEFKPAISQNDPVFLYYDIGKLYLHDQTEQSIGIAFVTANTNGLLLYQIETFNDEASRLVLKIKDRNIVLTVYNRDQTSYSLMANEGDDVWKRQLSDNKLHIAYIIKRPNQLILKVDDHVLATRDTDLGYNLYEEAIKSDLYIGNIPTGVSIPEYENFVNFEGCITQILFNNHELQFNLADRKSNEATFSKCFSIPIRTSVSKADNNAKKSNRRVQLTNYRQTIKLNDETEDITEGEEEEEVEEVEEDDEIDNNKKLVPSLTTGLNSECVLSKDYDASKMRSIGLRFGLAHSSRLEVVQSFPIRITSLVSFKFRTLNDNGLMFYASDPLFIDFIAVWLQNGQVNYAFDCGSGLMHIKTNKKYR
jgi:hypothetical protein